jgi:hypothetical protein
MFSTKTTRVTMNNDEQLKSYMPGFVPNFEPGDATIRSRGAIYGHVCAGNRGTT